MGDVKKTNVETMHALSLPKPYSSRKSDELRKLFFVKVLALYATF